MMNKKMNQKNLPWFPFYTAAWLGSDKVESMTMTERGIYVTLMAMCWQYGSITWDKAKLAKKLRIDQRVLGRFMENYIDLTQTLHEPSMEVTLPKLAEFAMTLRKSEGRSGTEETRGDDKHNTHKTEVASTSGVSVLKAKDNNKNNDKSNDLTRPTQNDSPSHHTVPTIPFDPLSFAQPVGDFTGSEVQRILLYHFRFNPSSYWTDPSQGNITSVTRLEQAINTMAKQVPSDWTPPAPKPVMRRTVGDPSCQRCRGRGRISIEVSNGDRHSVPCDACESRVQVAKGKEWVDAA